MEIKFLILSDWLAGPHRGSLILIGRSGSNWNARTHSWPVIGRITDSLRNCPATSLVRKVMQIRPPDTALQINPFDTSIRKCFGAWNCQISYARVVLTSCSSSVWHRCFPPFLLSLLQLLFSNCFSRKQGYISESFLIASVLKNTQRFSRFKNPAVFMWKEVSL